MEEKRKKWNSQTITILVLALLLVVSVGYIAFTVYQARKIVEQNTILQQGAQLGYQQAVLQLYQNAQVSKTSCQIVPVTWQNQTINLVAVECPVIQQALQSTQQK